jgi:Mrp family chromosome partitioning ATPase
MTDQNSNARRRPSLDMEEDAVMVEAPPRYSLEAPSNAVPDLAASVPTAAIAPAVLAATSAPPRHAELRSEEVKQPVLKPGDVVVVAMGLTGAGKSTFISLLSRDKDVVIGHDLRSST